jgi:hypothetical protein
MAGVLGVIYIKKKEKDERRRRPFLYTGEGGFVQCEI